MCKEAGIPTDDKSNHWLRETSATRMIDAGLQEVIMDRTGHHFLDGLKPYDRVTDLQQQQVFEVLTKESIKQEKGIVNEVKVEGHEPSKAEEAVKGLLTNNNMTGCTFNFLLKCDSI